MITHFRIGTRPSRLAVVQARTVVDELRAKWPHVVFDLFPISTEGDDRRGEAPEESEDFKRAFTGRLEEALLEGRVDAAIHSCKDMPAGDTEGTVIGAVPRREAPNDAFVGRRGVPLPKLRRNARIGTGSFRRAAQLRARWPGLRVQPVEGNVDTRLRKLEEGAFDGLVLAAAGLRRLGLEERITEVLPTSVMLPAAGQGALAVQIRGDDSFAREIVEAVEDRAARAEVEAERALARTLGIGCNVPAGALARAEGTVLRLEALVSTPDGRRMARASGEGSTDDPHSLADRVARDLIEADGAGILGLEVPP